MSDRMYPLSEAASLLHVSPKTLKTWLNEGGPEPVNNPRDRREWLIDGDAVRRLAAENHKRLDPSFGSEGAADVTDGAGEAGSRKDPSGHTRTGPDAHPMAAVFTGQTPETLAEAYAQAGPSIDETVRQVIAYLDGARPGLPGPWPGGSDLIFTTFGQHDPFFLASQPVRDAWLEALRRAYAQYHRRVVHLIQFDDDTNRTARIVKFLIRALPRIGALYYPACSRHLVVPSSEYVVVPDRGVLKLSLSGDRIIESAIEIFPWGSAACDELLSTIKLWRDSASALVARYSPSEAYRFHQAIARLEAEPGDRCLVMNGLSDLTVPSVIQFARARLLEDRLRQESLTQASRSEISHDAPMGIYRAHVRREAAFDNVVQRHVVRDICPLQVVRHYVRTGIYCPHDWFATQDCILRGDDRRLHLQHLIKRMNTTSNYHLALIDRDDQIDPALYNTFWLVKQGYGVLIEAVSINAQGQHEELNFEISEHHVTQAFYSFSLELWDSIRNHRKGRIWVTRILANLMREIP